MIVQPGLSCGLISCVVAGEIVAQLDADVVSARRAGTVRRQRARSVGEKGPNGTRGIKYAGNDKQ